MERRSHGQHCVGDGRTGFGYAVVGGKLLGRLRSAGWPERLRRLGAAWHTPLLREDVSVRRHPLHALSHRARAKGSVGLRTSSSSTSASPKPRSIDVDASVSLLTQRTLLRQSAEVVSICLPARASGSPHSQAARHQCRVHSASLNLRMELSKVSRRFAPKIMNLTTLRSSATGMQKKLQPDIYSKFSSLTRCGLEARDLPNPNVIKVASASPLRA